MHEFRKDVPPGWAPGIPDYPLRLFFERLKLWYSVYDGDDTMVGPLVAGRLQGKAQRLGMQLRLPRPDGGVDVGSDALVRLSIEEVRDPYNPSVVLQQHCPSGVQALCNSLRAAFGISDQEMVSRSIEDFMEFRRGKLSFSEYAVEWEIRLEEATARAGFEVNEVAKFYLFFRNSGLPAKLIEDIKLQVQGDMRRFIEAKTLALRLVNRGTDAGAELYVEENWNDENYFAEDWDEYDWTEDGWSWAEDFTSLRSTTKTSGPQTKAGNLVATGTAGAAMAMTQTIHPLPLFLVEAACRQPPPNTMEMATSSRATTRSKARAKALVAPYVALAGTPLRLAP